MPQRTIRSIDQGRHGRDNGGDIAPMGCRKPAENLDAAAAMAGINPATGMRAISDGGEEAVERGEDRRFHEGRRVPDAGDADQLAFRQRGGHALCLRF